jgi:hypothetical protein
MDKLNKELMAYGTAYQTILSYREKQRGSQRPLLNTYHSNREGEVPYLAKRNSFFK